jgi:16S rRNA (cytidine1402-2'-O)-methyltransferase
MFGFAPNRANARSKWLEGVAQTPHTFSFFEVPHRIRQTLTQAGSLFGIRPIVAARELTKVHQEFVRGTAAELSEHIKEPRGEYTIIVGPVVNTFKENTIPDSDAMIAGDFWRLTESGLGSRRAIVKEIARKSGRTSKEIYSAIERAKNSPE